MGGWEGRFGRRSNSATFRAAKACAVRSLTWYVLRALISEDGWVDGAWGGERKCEISDTVQSGRPRKQRGKVEGSPLRSLGGCSGRRGTWEGDGKNDRDFNRQKETKGSCMRRRVFLGTQSLPGRREKIEGCECPHHSARLT